MRRAALVITLLVITSALAASCSSDLAGGPPSVTLGHGYDRFTAISDGDDVPITRGTQGGFHIFGALRARNLVPEAVDVVFTIERPGDTSPWSRRRDLADLQGEFGELRGIVVFLPDPAAVRDVPCRFAVEITDRDGRRATSSRTIVPRDQ